MKHRLKQLIGITLVIFLGTFLLSWPAVLRLIIQSELQQARKNGHHISWSGLSTGMKSASVESLTVWVPGPKIKGGLSIPVSVDLQGVAVALHAAPLLMLQPSVAFETLLYGGSIKGDADLTRSNSKLSARVDNVEVGKHPQIAALGVRGGTLTGRIDQMVFDPAGPSQGTFSLSVRQLSVPALGTAKTLLRIDDLGAFDLDTAGTVTPKAIEISSLRLVSEFGEASGQVTAQNHLTGSPNISGELHVSLSQHGSQVLGPWLPLIPGAGLQSDVRTFYVRMAPLPCSQARAGGAFISLGGGCAKLSFTRG